MIIFHEITNNYRYVYMQYIHIQLYVYYMYSVIRYS